MGWLADYACTLRPVLPVCYFCRRRVGVTGCVVRYYNGTHTLARPADWELPFRKFVQHSDRQGRPCQGSGQMLAVARGPEAEEPS